MHYFGAPLEKRGEETSMFIGPCIWIMDACKKLMGACHRVMGDCVGFLGVFRRFMCTL